MDMSTELSDPWVPVLEKIKCLTYFYDKPRPGFDPRRASSDLLGRYGLPPRPPRSEKVRYAFWNTMFSVEHSARPVTFVHALSGDGFTYEELDKTTFPPTARIAFSGGQETSANWSGAYLTPRDGHMFTEVHGSFTVPHVTRPFDPDFDEPDCDEDATTKRYRCSTWVGLDGQRTYFNSSLPQMGTSQYVDVVSGRPGFQSDVKVWWQWWMRDVEIPKPILLPLPVRPGDKILASLFVVDETHVKYLIANHTQGVVCTPFVEPDPTTYLPAFNSHDSGTCETDANPHEPVRVSGASAEWITERPASWTTKAIFDLPDFAGVPFDLCHVVSGGAPGQDERQELPGGMRLISMYVRSKQPRRKRTVASSRRLGQTSFVTSYVGPPSRASIVSSDLAEVVGEYAVGAGASDTADLGSAADQAD
jgi:hypothetical protein